MSLYSELVTMDWAEFIEVIQQYRDKKITVIEPGGNRGDELIYLGMEKILSEIGVEYEVFSGYYDSKLSWYKWKFNNLVRDMSNYLFDIPDLENPEVILIQGGGNFNMFFPTGYQLYHNLVKNYPNVPIIVGPQSIWSKHDDIFKYLGSPDQDVYIFCREKFSYEFLDKHRFPENINIRLADDTALYLSKSDLMDYYITNKNGQTNYDLIYFRQDNMGVISERKVDKLKSQSEEIVEADISDSDTYSFEDYVTIANDSKRIHTNRLHGAILGHVLNKEVHMYDVPYFKNRYLYKHSLKDTDMQFHDAI